MKSFPFQNIYLYNLQQKKVAVAFSVENIVFMKLFSSFGLTCTILCILPKKVLLSSEYVLQLKIKRLSSSTSFVLQSVQILFSLLILGLEYFPVSTIKQ